MIQFFRLLILVGCSTLTLAPAQSQDFRRPGSQRDAVLCGGTCRPSVDRDDDGLAEARAEAREERRQREELRARYDDVRLRASAAWDRGDLQEALQLLHAQQALIDGPNIRAAIAMVEDRIARKAADGAAQKAKAAYEQGDQRTALALYQQALAIDPDYLTDEGKQWVRDLESRLNASTALQQSTGAFTQGLAPTQSVGNLDFISGDAMVVDARHVPSGLPEGMDRAISTAYSSAPPIVADQVRKGFQAVMEHDWTLARAWFQTALRHDPNNASLKQLVARVDSPVPATAKTPGSAGGPLQLPDPNDIYYAFPGLEALDEKQAMDMLFGLN